MAEYVTQGTVQVEIESSRLLIRINPNQDYSVKHNKKSYIIFMPKYPTQESTQSTQSTQSTLATLINAKALENSSKGIIIHEQNDDRLAQALTQAAFKQTNIEIVIDIDGNNIITKIQSIKIPATSSPETV